MAAKRKNSNPLSKKTEWTITEFQMWLAGAYALQGDDWVPNAEQWDMVVDIIYKLKDRPTQKKVVTQLPPQMYQQPVHVTGMPTEFNPEVSMGGSVLEAPPLPDEANLPLSELKRRREGGPSNASTLRGNGAPGEKEIKLGSYG